MTTLEIIRTLHRLHGHETPGLAAIMALAGILFTATWIMLP